MLQGQFLKIKKISEHKNENDCYPWSYDEKRMIFYQSIVIETSI